MYFRWKFLFNNIFLSEWLQLFCGVFISIQLALCVKNLLALCLQYSAFLTLVSMGILSQFLEGLTISFLLLSCYYLLGFLMTRLGLTSLFDGSFFSISLPDSDHFES